VTRPSHERHRKKRTFLGKSRRNAGRDTYKSGNYIRKKEKDFESYT
jgi:hypothetical protein